MTSNAYKTFFLLIVICVLIGDAAAQKSKSSVGRLNSSKPTIYISLRNAKIGVNDDASIILEIHNNTRWNLICYLTPVQAQSGNLPIIYKVEDDKRNQVYSNQSGDVVFQQTVAPGKSIPFVVLKEHLERGNSIYVEFNYAWEVRNGISPYGSEPNHRVVYGWYDLPKRANK